MQESTLPSTLFYYYYFFCNMGIGYKLTLDNTEGIVLGTMKRRAMSLNN